MFLKTTLLLCITTKASTNLFMFFTPTQMVATQMLLTNDVFVSAELLNIVVSVDHSNYFVYIRNGISYILMQLILSPEKILFITRRFEILRLNQFFIRLNTSCIKQFLYIEVPEVFAMLSESVNRKTN